MAFSYRSEAPLRGHMTYQHFKFMFETSPSCSSTAVATPPSRAAPCEGSRRASGQGDGGFLFIENPVCVGALCAVVGRSVFLRAPRNSLALHRLTSRAWRMQLRAATEQGQDEVSGKTLEMLENLSAALELAVRAGDTKEAARLRERLQDVELASPRAALVWRQQRQVRQALDTVMHGAGETRETRIQALRSLEQLASPPLAAMGAEEALHKILLEVAGTDAGPVRELAAEALWGSWHNPERETCADAFNRGIELMSSKQAKEAVEAFSEVIDDYPDFVEALNKRASAYYALKNYVSSIVDCLRVLELKPRHFGCLTGLGMCYLDQGNSAQAALFFKKALQIHPGMKSTREALDRVDREENMQRLLEPRADEAVKILEEETAKPVDSVEDLVSAECKQDVAVQWDVHRVVKRGAIAAGTGPQVYFFRVCIKNKMLGPCPVRSLGRFYSLRFKSGQVFPLMRPTEGAAEFTLESGEEYKYSWAFTVGQPLVGVIGGMLLERLHKVCEEDDVRFIHVGLDLIAPCEAPDIYDEQVGSLSRDHVYMGQLDLRQIPGT